ncbi:endonuclease/exonuclease/phosphatase family protein [Arsenicicoccus dermatophilus]|uniref:endonuclease/exonuclease/phosphatase family protein n=1 Tax=Arsenicicoccus dermatophilus TaxID=1076331 RepID=UPI003916F3AF
MTSAQRPVRVASYNLRDLLDDRQAAATVVRAIDPDVLLLQEVPRRAWPAPRVRSWARAAGLRWPGSHQGAGGTTVMVSDRVVVASCVHRGLPVPPGQRTRGYAEAVVQLPGGRRLTAASIHLGLYEGQRLRHVRQVLASLPATGPLVVGGDLNEGQGAPSWTTLAARLTALSPPVPTYPSWDPVSRLDVVWGRDVDVLAGPEPCLDPDLLSRATDHLPVWVDLQVG